ncbi:ABC transporter permease subunit [Luedemannella flava]|uniref:ABC transporter permease subunit n=1 Tax=Luedemannella flava TaxID=349316 RepID=UPI0031E2E15D
MIDAAKTSLTGVLLGQAVVAVLAVVVVAGEYGDGTIRATLTAVPRRGAVLAAKAVTLTGPVLLAGLVAVAGSLAVGRAVLPGRGFALDLTDAATLRAGAGSVLYLALVALLALGVATVVRNAAGGIGIVLGMLYLFPVLTEVVTDPRWERRLRQIAPSTAGQAVQTTLGVDTLPIGPWQGLGVLALWAAGALLAGWLVLRLRDA